MARKFYVQKYRNSSGRNRLSVMMDEATARELTGYDGEEKARVALVQMSEALIEQLSPAEDEVTTRR
jgi:hypothetical protein